MAYQRAAQGKRGHRPAAAFEHQIADHLIDLQHDLRTRRYRPGAYVNFFIHEPKRRMISAAPFRDRVVHHALCNLIEPIFDRQFIPDSYANRLGKGTHRAIDRLQRLARQYPYVLRADIVKHFPSVDHAVLQAELQCVIQDDDTRWLIDQILASSAGVLRDDYTMIYFPGDDLFAIDRPRGLPIGNLTSQFWSNCYLNPLDHFIVRDLGCHAYLRYVDDIALFAKSPRILWSWRRAIVDRLAELRLTLHLNQAQPMSVQDGIPWLGFVVFPEHRLLKRRNVTTFRRRLVHNLDLYQTGQISFAELDASVQGWINHVRYADTWGLRRQLFRSLPIPAPQRAANTASTQDNAVC